MRDGDRTPLTEQQVLAGMNQLWRRNIKKADKSGVAVSVGGREDLKAFHDLYVHTAERDGFTPRPLSYFETMYDALSAEDPDRITLHLAHHALVGQLQVEERERERPGRGEQLRLAPRELARRPDRADRRALGPFSHHVHHRLRPPRGRRADDLLRRRGNANRCARCAFGDAALGGGRPVCGECEY